MVGSLPHRDLLDMRVGRQSFQQVQDPFLRDSVVTEAGEEARLGSVVSLASCLPFPFQYPRTHSQILYELALKQPTNRGCCRLFKSRQNKLEDTKAVF